ncbi:FCP1-like proteiny domain-containing protein [Favolaschia claudopus]|uniref:FCP1-like proteiny domain-containing protein n=1 Tax=Favolaschia claudopus TaxID=2862362 RepID=A0AAW0C4G3_9AGAR
MFPGPYFTYSGTQPFYNSEYNYYNLDNSNGFVDGYYVRNHSGYGGGYAGNYMANDFNYQQLRERSPTPPPPPAAPSPEYLATSLQRQPASAPSGQRKLLIFDLNGTLLLRSPRGYGQRKIYLRPYARSLVAYIAHPIVRSWLDCMVWSSAQAHNVREMVERVFGVGEGAGSGPILRAVWARDTLGLGREAFHQKTQTTKDLAKPWAFFAKPPYSPTLDGRSNDCLGRFSPPPPSQSPPRSSSPPPSSAPLAIDIDVAPELDPPPPYPHGPETTLLVDDSPLKARLQPYNHLCVAEYDAATRARDREAARLPPDSDPVSAGDDMGVNADEVPYERAAEIRPVKKERWRKRRREEEAAKKAAEANKNPDEITIEVDLEDVQTPQEEAVAATADTAAATEDSTSTTVVDTSAETDAPAQPQTQNPSKRSKRRERKRQKKLLKAGDNAVNDPAPISMDESSADVVVAEQVVVASDELAEGSGSGISTTASSPADPELSSPVEPEIGVEEAAPPLNNNNNAGESLNPVVAVEMDAAGETETETLVAASSPIPISFSSPAADTIDSESRKRKRRQSTDAEESLEVEPASHSLKPPAPAETIVDAVPPCTDGEPYDPTLLAVIGVLSHVRSVGNVAAWIRSGGLASVVEDADESLPARISTDQANEDKRRESIDVLSSDPSQWFASRRVLVAWAARGRAALEEIGVDAIPGVE